MAKKPSVLVVDDFADGREMVAEYLAFRGFTVTEARDGEEAIELARKLKPEIVLMDLRMPGMDGWEATRRLKKDPQTRHIPVVALTAHALTPEIAAARNAGCDAVVAKPCDIGALADSLIKMLKLGPHVVEAALAPSRHTRATKRTRS
jgi:two-component system cell cycle response regulator DivK